ncbi:MAG: hypothetical protein ACKN94_14250 [Pirellulaceae bacterium]
MPSRRPTWVTEEFHRIPRFMNSPISHADRSQWLLRDDTTYLNHGSFGPPPREVWEAQRTWQQACSQQPMDFYLRQMESACSTRSISWPDGSTAIPVALLSSKMPPRR